MPALPCPVHPGEQGHAGVLLEPLQEAGAVGAEGHHPCPAEGRVVVSRDGQLSATRRGYGTEHQKLRREWARRVDAGEVTCSRCGRYIPPGGEGPCPAIHRGRRCGKNHGTWHLGHHDLDRTRYTGPEHVCCNTATRTHAAQRRGRSIANRALPDWWKSEPRHSEEWR